MVKPGIKSTEFWVTMSPWILSVIVLVGLVAGSIEPDTALSVLTALGIGGGIGNAGYSYSRAKVKAKS